MSAKNKIHHRFSERGNALWFILIAIVLMGAITVMLTRSGSSVDQSGDREQLSLKASQIMRYGKSVQTAIQQLMLRGCSENEISFETDVTSDYDNTRSPDDLSCHIFKGQGAGLSWQNFGGADLVGWNDSILFTADIHTLGVGEDALPAGKDLVMLVSVSKDLCTQINKMVDAPSATAAITSDIDDLPNEFTGSFPGSGLFNIGGGAGNAPGLNGFEAACVYDDAGDPIFYQVVLVR